MLFPLKLKWATSSFDYNASMIITNANVITSIIIIIIIIIMIILITDIINIVTNVITSIALVDFHSCEAGVWLILC